MFHWCWGQCTFASYLTHFHLANLLCLQTIISIVVFQPNYSNKIMPETYHLCLLLLPSLAVCPYLSANFSGDWKEKYRLLRTEHRLTPLFSSRAWEIGSIITLYPTNTILIHSGDRREKCLPLQNLTGRVGRCVAPVVKVSIYEHDQNLPFLLYIHFLSCILYVLFSMRQVRTNIITIL